jgi:hypothetical protein
MNKSKMNKKLFGITLIDEKEEVVTKEIKREVEKEKYYIFYNQCGYYRSICFDKVEHACEIAQIWNKKGTESFVVSGKQIRRFRESLLEVRES